MFRARGENPRFGLFKDNVLITESKGKGKVDSQGQLLHMVPELMSQRTRTKRKRMVGKSMNQSSTNSTNVTFKLSKRSTSKSHRR